MKLFRSAVVCCLLVATVAGAAEKKKAPPKWTWATTGKNLVWSDAKNWMMNNVPPATAEGHILIEPKKPLALKLDRDQTVKGLLKIGEFRGRTTFDLGGNTLTIEEGALDLGFNRADVSVTNGTVRIGTAESAADLKAFYKAGEGNTVSFGADVTLKLDNVRAVSVCEAEFNRSAVGTLDLTRAIIPGNAIACQALAVGTYKGFSPGYRSLGVLKLSPALRSLTAGSVILGENHRPGKRGKATSVAGTIDFEGIPSLEWTIGGELALARGDNAQAELKNLPADLRLQIGSADALAVLHIGYKNRTQVGCEPADNTVKGSLVLAGGFLAADLSELRVGENTQEGGEAIGVLDLSKAQARINVAGPVVVGAQGAATLQISSGKSGLNITGDKAALSIAKGGTLTLAFTCALNDAKGEVGGLCVAGDCEALLKECVADKRIVITSKKFDVGQVTVTLKDGVTRIGVN